MQQIINVQEKNTSIKYKMFKCMKLYYKIVQFINILLLYILLNYKP